MSTRVSTNIGHRMTRHLAKVFTGSTKAVDTADPNGLHTNTPVPTDAMGIAGSSGIVSFCHLEATAKTFTIWYWNQLVNDANAAKGWIKLGPANTVYQLAVDPAAAASFTVEEGALLYFTADATITDFFTGGCTKHPSATADLHSGAVG